MTYKVNRALGYQPWGVTNPWVFANYGQPQRMRGYVSPMVFQTRTPQLQSAYLGQTGPIEAITDAVDRGVNELRRAERMEKIAIAGLALSTASLILSWSYYSRTVMKPNRRRRRRNR